MNTPNVIMMPVEAISVGDRQRTPDKSTEKHIEELRNDVEENGLFHAPTVDTNHQLVAGWCRLQAVKLLSKPYMYGGAEIAAGFIPVVVTHHQDERVLTRIELMENLKRKNLTPMDEARAIAKLHKMFVTQEGVDWSKADTARELDNLRGVEPRSPQMGGMEVGDSLLLDSFENDPDIAKAKSRSEAVKIAKKKLEQQLTTALGEFKPNTNEGFTILHGRCQELWGNFEPNTFNGIVTDPPYGIDADEFGEQTMALGHQYKDDTTNALEVAASIFRAGYTITKDDAHLYMFCDIRLFRDLSIKAYDAGWKPFATPLIWHKEGLGHAPQPGFFSRRYECILFAQKGNRRLSKSRSDVFSYPSVKDKIHAAQKPVELISELLRLSFFPGETILDPCCGSGTIFKAAKLTSLRATGIEVDENNYNICKKIISEL